MTSDDPENRTMALRLKATIVGSVEILPRAFVTLPSAPNNEYATQLLIRKEKSEKGELNVTDATASVPWIVVKPRKVEKAEPPTPLLPAAEPGDFVLDISIPDDTALTQSGQQIRFKTGLTRETQTALPVSVVYQQPLTANPATVVLMALDGVKEASGTFEVTVRSNLASQPVTASVTPQNFTVKLEPDGPRHYKANIGWKSEGDSPVKLGWVTLQVVGESLRVPVRVRDKPPAKLQVPATGQLDSGPALVAPVAPPANGAPANGAAPPANGGTPPASGPDTPPPPQKP